MAENQNQTKLFIVANNSVSSIVKTEKHQKSCISYLLYKTYT